MTHVDSTATASDAPRRIPPPPSRSTATAPAHIAPSHAPAGTISIDENENVTETATVIIRAWIDPVVDETGHDPRSRYVERFWLGVLGPTATWLLRRLASELDEHPDGYSVDLVATAKVMGLSYGTGRSSPFSKALQRCTMFGLAHQTSDGLAVRRRIPPVAHRHLRKMPASVQREHDRWEAAATVDTGFPRAHSIAVAMIGAGDALEEIEHQLIAVGVAPSTAAEVADNASRL